MKKLMIGLALAAFAATPALANSGHSRMSNWSDQSAGYGAYDYAPGSGFAAYDDAGMGSYPVFADGKYQGSDPDPFIRDQLRRDPASISGGGD